MDLFPYEQRHLDWIEGDLRGEEPELASMFDVFTRLARGEGKPPAERQLLAGGRWREAAFARQHRRRLLLLVVTAVLAALATVAVLSFT